MDSTNIVTSTIRLEGENNWNVWKFQVRVVLNSFGLLEVTNGTTPRPADDSKDLPKWLEKDAKAQSIIVTRLAERVIAHVVNCNTAAEIWCKLHSVYELKSSASIHLLQQKFFGYSYLPGSTMGEHISQLQDIAKRLLDLGQKIDDRMLITKILMSLPEEFRHFISAWESVEESKQTLNDLTARLLLEEQRLGERVATGTSTMDRNTAFAARAPSHRHRFEKKEKSYEKQVDKVCYFCKKPGHFIRQCRFRINKEKIKNNNAFVVCAMVGLCDSEDWIMDSGATHHLCKSKELFYNYVELKQPEDIILGDGRVILARGKGDIKLEAFNGSNWMDTTMYNVFYVPDIKVNLFSVACALDRDYLLMSNNNKCYFLNQDGSVAAEAIRDRKMFVMKLRVVQKPSVLLGVNVTSLQEWHEVLAHQNFEHVRRILSEKNIKYTDDKNNVCVNCIKGKQHKLPFERSTTKSSRTLELIHADLCGPMEEKSLGGASYYLLIKDDYSHYRAVYFLKDKSQVCEKIKHFITFAEKETGNTVEKLRTDRGTEFFRLKNFLEEKGIKHETSVSYTPQQNGKIEREMRTVSEAARTMLHAKSLGKEFWAEAVAMAVYVLNRTGTSTVTGKSPFCLWSGKEFENISQLKVFGSTCYVHVPDQLRRKWDAKGEPGLLMGYGEGTKGYRVYLLEKRVVTIKRDIIFIENEQKSGQQNYKNTADTGKKTLAGIEKLEINSIQERQENVENVVNSDDNIITNRGSIEGQGTIDLDPGSGERVTCVVEESENDNFESYESENQCEEQGRGKRVKRVPEKYKNFVLLTYNEAMKSHKKEKWMEAINQEIQSLKQNKVWEVVNQEEAKGHKILTNRWVFRVKDDGTYKARLVIRGNEQQDVDYDEIFSPVASMSAIRTLLALSAAKNFQLMTFDVKTAFLNGELREDENIFMRVPSGMDVEESKVLKLKKSLYGLRQSPRRWNETFLKTMKEMGFVQAKNEPCIFRNNDSSVVLAIYVDDGLIVGKDKEEILKILTILNKRFEIRINTEPKTYLGMELKKDSNGLYITQTEYTKSVLRMYNMQNCKNVDTPYLCDNKKDMVEEEGMEKIKFPYREAVGSLLYLSTRSRPDIAYAVGIASRNMENPKKKHVLALKRILKYLSGTLGEGLFYKFGENVQLTAYSDADYAGDIKTRRSTSGYVIFFGEGPISWASRKQPIVALSSTEAEFIAAADCCKETMFLKSLLLDIGIDIPVTCKVDNQSAIKLVKTGIFNKRSKHIDVRYHYIHELYCDGKFKIDYCSTLLQTADVFTKPLSKIKFTEHKFKIIKTHDVC